MNMGFNDLWPTTVLNKKIENEELVNRVCQDIIENFDMDNMPSDFDDFNILDNGNDLYDEFKEKIVIPTFDEYLTTVFGKSVSYFKKSKFKGWLAGSNSGYSISVHNHSGATLSGVFYLFCEDFDKGGDLVMIDPRANANRGYMKEVGHIFSDKVFTPRSSTAIIFPSFLYHYTTMFKGKLRIAMPVDFYPGVL